MSVAEDRPVDRPGPLGPARSGAGPAPGRVLAVLAVAWCAMSSAAPFIVIAAPLAALVIATTRLLVTSVVWSWLARAQLPGLAARLRAQPRVLGAAIVAGLFLALHFGLWIGSLSLTSVTHATVLVATQPLFAGLFARLGGERVSALLYLGTVIAMVGTAILTLGTGEGAQSSALGDLLALGAAAAAALYLSAGSRVGERLGLAAYMAIVNPVAGLALLAAALLSGVTWFPADAGWVEWGAVLWLGLVPGLIGHGAMNWASRYIPVHTVSLAVLLEPIGATALAVLFLASQVGPYDWLGGGLMLLGAGLGLRRA